MMVVSIKAAVSQKGINMKFKLSKMSRKKQIAIACAVAAGASAAALIILGVRARRLLTAASDAVVNKPGEGRTMGDIIDQGKCDPGETEGWRKFSDQVK